MKAEVIAYDGAELTLQVKVKMTGSLFEIEHAILHACNEMGKLATLNAIKNFDTDGSYYSSHGEIQVSKMLFSDSLLGHKSKFCLIF